MPGILIALIVLLVIVVVFKQIGIPVPRRGGAGSEVARRIEALPYRRRDYLLSKAERSFYEVLRSCLSSEVVIFAKVRLIDLLWLPKGTENRQRHLNRVMSKHVDFVLCDTQSIRPLLVIELDDASHQRSDRMARDTFVDEILAAAGLPILHVDVRRGYVVEDLKGEIRVAINSAPATAV